VLLSDRRTRVAEIDAEVATKALVHTRYRVHVVHNRNVVCDDEIFLPAMARVGRVSRPVLTIILAGRARVRMPGGFERWLEASDVALLPTKAAVAMRQEGAEFRSVAIEWDEGPLGDVVHPTPDVMRLGVRDGARVAAIAGALEACDSDRRAAALLAELLDVLRSVGASLARAPAGSLVEATGAQTKRLSRALDTVLSHLAAGPALTDLDELLALSPRQMNRVVAGFNERYGFNSAGWRDTRNRRRLLVGATMMTAAGARTELVARAMGYASPTSFCHAFDLANLPSPGAIADAVAKLR
jgi:hypothetical protein